MCPALHASRLTSRMPAAQPASLPAPSSGVLAREQTHPFLPATLGACARGPQQPLWPAPLEVMWAAGGGTEWAWGRLWAQVTTTAGMWHLSVTHLVSGSPSTHTHTCPPSQHSSLSTGHRPGAVLGPRPGHTTSCARTPDWPYLSTHTGTRGMLGIEGICGVTAWTEVTPSCHWGGRP